MFILGCCVIPGR